MPPFHDYIRVFAIVVGVLDLLMGIIKKIEIVCNNQSSTISYIGLNRHFDFRVLHILQITLKVLFYI